MAAKTESPRLLEQLQDRDFSRIVNRASVLVALLKSKEFRAWEDLLHERKEYLVNKMITCDKEHVEYVRGALGDVMLILSLPQKAIDKAKELADGRREDREDEDAE